MNQARRQTLRRSAAHRIGVRCVFCCKNGKEGIGLMLCVGFLEEVIFRGLLFKALAKDNIKSAVVISSVTFGIGHIINLFNGSGMDFVNNLCQIVFAIALGFLLVTIFYRGGSLLPCILVHSAINTLGTFASDAGLTMEILARAVSFFCRSITLALLNFCVSSHLHCSVRLTQVELSADTANTTGGSGNRAARCVRL